MGKAAESEIDCIGYLDAVRYRTVYGWAHDPREPNRAPVVRIQINGTDNGLAIADRPRPDLAENGVTTEPRGFEYTVPDSYVSVDSVKVLTVDGSVLPLSSPSIICRKTNGPLPSEWKSGDVYRFPSFFILGAAKCGTSSLHGYLGQHPEICVSNPKEPFYFEAEFDRGPTYYFNRYFSHWSGERIVGEARHRNLYMPYAPERISRFNPRARLIVCVRNPAERAISHWWHFFSRNLERLSLERSIQEDWERIQAGAGYADQSSQDVYVRTLGRGKGVFRTYVDSGYYYEQIQRYLAIFPRDQLRIVLLEDFAQDPIRGMAELLEFLGADPAYARKIDCTPVNQSDRAMLQHVDGETLAWLVRHYRPHNELLSQLIGRKLEHWDLPFEGRELGK